MKQLTLNIDTARTKEPMYLRIASAIREAIKSGQLQGDEQLPSARMLCERLNVNRHTVMAAINELVAEGWVDAKPRKGYFVMPSLPSLTSLSQNDDGPQQQRFRWQLAKQFKPLPERTAAECQFNFSGGCPDIGLFPAKVFAGYLQQATLRADRRALNYGNSAGYAPFLAQVERYLRRVRSLTGKRIIAVNGSQEALFLLAGVLLNPGDKVAVEKLGYQPAWSAFRSAGAQLIGINQDEQGIDPEHLEQMAKRQKLKLIYLTPLHQYPTTVTLPIARRMQIYDIAAKYSVAIVEDDYDHEFHYRCQPLAPMAASDPQGLVIYLSTFSKIMFPGIRIGFIAADDALIDALLRYRLIANHKPNVLMQDAIARWMADGDFERHLRKLTRSYEKRRDHMVAVLRDYQAQGMALQFAVPDGGMALWIKTAQDAALLAEKAWQNSVFIQTENEFHLQRQDSQNRYIRLGFAAMDEDRMNEGMARIFAVTA